MTRRLPPPLVALSPGDLAPASTRRFLEHARKAVGTGLRAILVREPAMGDRALLDLAREVRALLPKDGWLGIHDRVHLAKACGADSVHLGFRSLAPREARKILAEEVAIGFSAHEGDDIGPWAAADYLFFGPVLDTPSKRGIRAPIGFEGLSSAVERSPVPVWAIGGLRPEHARASLVAGCAGIAVLSGLLPTRDPAGACAAYLLALGRDRN
jgi:thiamine-phosphate diphosphorylase